MGKVEALTAEEQLAIKERRGKREVGGGKAGKVN